MLLSKTAYYADFVIYAAVLLALGSLAALSADWLGRFTWLCAFTAGWALWTLLEYLMHRFVLHRVPPFAAMHALHHASPRAFIGTPTWLTLAILWLLFFLPAWRSVSFNVASGLFAGTVMGFLWYGILHHVILHGRPRILASLVARCARRHQRHHCSGRRGNYGVTVSLWDLVFKTGVP